MNTFEIDDVLEEMALEGRRHFAPHYVCQRLGISEIKGVTNYLLSLVGSKLIPSFEVECPNGDIDFAVNDPRLISKETRICHICREEYEPDPKRTWLAFDFTERYLLHVKKKKAIRGKRNSVAALNSFVLS